VLFSGPPRPWQRLQQLGLAFLLAGSGLTTPAIARESPVGVVAIGQLPPEARQTERLIRSGGPFAHAKDGVVFGNRERQLPAKPRGYYREYTRRVRATGAPGASSAAAVGRRSPRLVITPKTITRVFAASCSEPSSEAFFLTSGGT
jgi:ribonuclease T1